MLPKEAYEQAHTEYPLLAKYKNKPTECQHNFDFVVYCNGERDIVRCCRCGYEKEVRCTFDDEYD